MSKEIAVLISDIHYSLQTLELADKAMRQAIKKANELQIPLIVAGDLHDTKANLRGECVNQMIKTFETCEQPVYILIGNHDRLNEKAPAHSLSFLGLINKVTIVSKPYWYKELGLVLIPYHHDTDMLRAFLRSLPTTATLIMHQGLEGSNAGDYIQDKSAITHDDVKDFRVISGHYHTRQDIKTDRPRKGAVGLWSYIGNPYTVNFGEANDPEKGFQILMDDGALEFVPTNLRKHVIVEYVEGQVPFSKTLIKPEDLVWVKARGSKLWLNGLSKKRIFNDDRINFKLELTSTDSPVAPKTSYKSQPEQLDAIVDQLSPDDKIASQRRKDLWRDLCES